MSKQDKMNFTRDDYHAWKHHPVSKEMFKFWQAYRDHLINELMSRWLSGGLSLLEEKEIRGRILWLDEMQNLPYESIEQFLVKPSTEPMENETKIVEPG